MYQVINNTTTDISYNENDTVNVVEIDATDADNDTLTYSISGDDKDSFNIDSNGL